MSVCTENPGARPAWSNIMPDKNENNKQQDFPRASSSEHLSQIPPLTIILNYDVL
jgi:hypothetical protein